MIAGEPKNARVLAGYWSPRWTSRNWGSFGFGGRPRDCPEAHPRDVKDPCLAQRTRVIRSVRPYQCGALLHPRREVRDQDRIGHAQGPVVPGRAVGESSDENHVGGDRYKTCVAVADPPLAEANRVARSIPDIANADLFADLADVRKRPVGRPGRLPAGKLEAGPDAGEIAVPRRPVIGQRR